MAEDIISQLQNLVSIAVAAVCVLITSLLYKIITENEKLKREQGKGFVTVGRKLQLLEDLIKEKLDEPPVEAVIPVERENYLFRDRVRQESIAMADPLEYMRDANPLFLGRDDMLDNIYESYRRDRPEDYYATHHPSTLKTVVHIINGLAGCGKSEIAIQYVNKYSRQYSGGVLWIPAGSLSTLDYVLKQTVEKLHLSEDKTHFRANHTQKVITEWLKMQTDWLLVFDNADDAGCIYDYFPRFPYGGHIIITSRDRRFKSSLYPAIKAPYEVKPLTQEDAELLLAKSYFIEAGRDTISRDEANQKLEKMKEGDPKEYEALNWLAGPNGLDGLPLALNTATTYMRENDRSFTEYKDFSQKCVTPALFPEPEDDPLKAWLHNSGLMKYYDKLKGETQRSLTAFLDLTERDLRNIGLEDSEVKRFMADRNHDVNINKWMYRRKRVLATWSLTFRKINEMTNGSAAMELLKLCVYLTPTLSENIIVKGAEFITLENLKEKLLEKVKSHPSESDKDLQIQRNLDEILQCLRRYSLIENLPSPKGKSHTRRSFTIHRVVRKAVKVDLKREDIIKTLSCAIKLLTNLMPPFEDMKRNITRHFRPITEIQEEVAMHVKNLLQNLKQDYLKSDKGGKVEIEDPLPLLNTVALYFDVIKSRPEEAQNLYAKAFECIILTTVDDPETRARKLGYAGCQLGQVLVKLGERKDAISHLKAAEEQFSKYCKDINSDIDMAKYNYLLAQALGDEYWELGKRPPSHIKVEIEGTLERAISISKKCHEKLSEEYGEWTALSLHELASFRLQMGSQDLQTIEQQLIESLEIKQRIWRSEDDGDHISTAIGMTDLARFYILKQDQSKFGKVEELLLKALKIKEQVLQHYQQSNRWQLGVYYLVRLYMLLDRKDDEKKYRDMVEKADTKRSFDELFEASNPYKAYPPEPFFGHESYC